MEVLAAASPRKTIQSTLTLNGEDHACSLTNAGAIPLYLLICTQE
jgi:hypothetical protein